MISDASKLVCAVGSIEPGVLSGQKVNNSTKFMRVEGSCYWVTEKIAVTASHVVPEDYSGQYVFRYGVNGVIDYTKISAVYRNNERDLAVIATDSWFSSSVIFKLDSRKCSLLERVVTLGYANSLDGHNTPRIRGYSGEINGVAPLKIAQINLEFAYELSFPAPRGLSGSPLFQNERVIGTIIMYRGVQQLPSEDFIHYAVASPVDSWLVNKIEDVKKNL